MRVCLLLVITLVLSGATPTVVLADTAAEENADRTEEARLRFRRGVSLYREGAFRAALIEFQRAYELKPHFGLLSNIGQTQLVLGDYLAASHALRGYLEQGGSEVPPDRREKVEKQLKSLQERIAVLTVSVNLQGAEVFLDGERIGVTPLSNGLSVNVGRHVVLVRSGEQEDSKVIDVAGGDVRDLEFALEQGSETPAMAATGTGGGASKASSQKSAPPKPAPRSTRELQRKIALGSLISAGALGAGTITALIFQKRSMRAYDEALDTQDVDPNVVAVHQANAFQRAVVVDVLAGLTLAAAGAGVTLWYLSKPEHSDQRPTLRVGLTGTQLMLKGGF